VAKRYMSLEALARIIQPQSIDAVALQAAAD
jgi:hypothetical protein